MDIKYFQYVYLDLSTRCFFAGNALRGWVFLFVVFFICLHRVLKVVVWQSILLSSQWFHSSFPLCLIKAFFFLPICRFGLYSHHQGLYGVLHLDSSSSITYSCSFGEVKHIVRRTIWISLTFTGVGKNRKFRCLWHSWCVRLSVMTSNKTGAVSCVLFVPKGLWQSLSRL